LVLVDTSVAVALRENVRHVGDRFAQLSTLPSISIVSVVELEGGVAAAEEGRAARRRLLDKIYAALEIIPFGEQEAEAYSRIISELGFSRRLIIDRMIASQALVAGVALATLNPRDFRDIPGLNVEDWS
jgi:tRNA(fMet)-specific endonuclease VapC